MKTDSPVEIMTMKNPAVSLFMIMKKAASSFSTLHITAHDVTSRNTAHFIFTVVSNSNFRDRKAAQN